MRCNREDVISSGRDDGKITKATLKKWKNGRRKEETMIAYH